MKEEIKNLAIVFVLILSVVMLVHIINIGEMLKSGEHLVAARPQIILSADCPWSAMPPAIKEYISLNATDITYLNKADMLQLSEYYRDLAKKYKEPIALINQKDFPQPKKEVVK